MPDPTQSVAEALAEVRERTGPPPEPTPEQKALCADGECGGCIICYGPGVPVFGPGTVVALADEVVRLSALLAGEGERERVEAEQEQIRDAGSYEEQRALQAGALPYAPMDRMAVLRHAGYGWAADEIERLRAGEGTTQPDPEVEDSFDGVLPTAEVARIRSVSGDNAVTQRRKGMERRASGEGTAPPPDIGPFDPETFRRFATTADPDALADLIEQATGAKALRPVLATKLPPECPLCDLPKDHAGGCSPVGGWVLDRGTVPRVPAEADGALSILRRLAITDEDYEWEIDTAPSGSLQWVRTDRDSRSWEYFEPLSEAEQAVWLRVVAADGALQAAEEENRHG